MNKQEVIDKLKKESWEYYDSTAPVIETKTVIEIINQIYEPEKPKVPQVAVEFYERYNGVNLALGEWFGDFYSPEAIEEFPRMDELTEWLYDNNDEINRQREFALATLVTLGIEAVEVEKEKLYTVEIPNPDYPDKGKFVLCKNKSGKVFMKWTCLDDWKFLEEFQLTESEIKKDFDWAFRWAKEVEE